MDEVSTARWRQSVIFWGVACVIMFAALGGRELWTAENRWAEVCRIMAQSGNYFEPQLNGESYFMKPLGSYWAILVVAPLTGGLGEFALRLPSALAGLAALWATRYLGRKLWSYETGVLAGWMLLSAQGFIFWARTAQADMANVAFGMLAVAWYFSRKPTGFVFWLVFYSICAVGAHFKGLGAVAIPILVMAPHLLMEGRWRTVFTLGYWGAVVTSVVVYLVPFLVAAGYADSGSQGGLEMVYRQNIQRFLDPFDHANPFYIYFYDLPLLFMPWAPLLVIGLVAFLAKPGIFRVASPSTKWLVLASLLVFSFFMASGSRRSYYILPLLPFCALLCARYLLTEHFQAFRRHALGIQMAIPLVGGIGCAMFLGLWLVLPAKWSELIPMAAAVGFSVVGLVALVPWVMRRWAPGAMERAVGLELDRSVVALGTALFLGGIFVFPLTAVDEMRNTKEFAVQSRLKVPVGDRFAFYGVDYLGTATLAFYLNQPVPIPRLASAAAVAEFLLSKPGDHVLLVRREKLDELEKSGEMPAYDTLNVEAPSPWDSEKQRGKKWMLISATRPGGM